MTGANVSAGAELPFFTYDVFTNRRYAGNPLAIVEEAGDLTTEQMQTIAREFNLSETIFVQPPDDPAHTAKVRIFFPTAEIPFAGHPTIGCAIHLARAAHHGSGDFSTRIILEEVAGIVPVEVQCSDGECLARLTSPGMPVPGEGMAADAALAAAAFGLEPDDIGFGDHVPGLFAIGHAFSFVPLSSRQALAIAKPSGQAWESFKQHTGSISAYCYCAGENEGSPDFHSRMFAPEGGIMEDPATGSATAMLAAQLAASNALKSGVNTFNIMQGEDMRRPSHLFLEADFDGASLGDIRVSGSAVPVSRGFITVP